ncbi:unnamed protein product [Amoebophrya sp. A120]|nr:unnamed protein product [Amoebophrya sp. A120]|eukprot:GSA120T00017131001.1
MMQQEEPSQEQQALPLTGMSENLVNPDDEQHDDDPEVHWTLLLEPGDEEALKRFLTTSHRWFSSMSSPPSREDFKLFLEGGFQALADLATTTSTSSSGGGKNINATSDTEGSSTAAQLLFQNPGPGPTSSAEGVGVVGVLDRSAAHQQHDPSVFLGSTTTSSSGTSSTSSYKAQLLHLLQKQAREVLELELHEDSWQNTTLEDFLDAATDVSGFRSGNYEQSWKFLLDFFQEGQTAE